MNILNLILVIVMYPIVFVFYFCLKNEGHEPRKGIYFGVSLNKEQAKDEALAQKLAQERHADAERRKNERKMRRVK